jgi:threonyl-tRNA synthetase
MVGTDWEPTASFTLIGCCAHYWRGQALESMFARIICAATPQEDKGRGGKEEEEEERERV